MHAGIVRPTPRVPGGGRDVRGKRPKRNVRFAISAESPSFRSSLSTTTMALSIAVTAHETGMGLLSPSLAAYDVHAVSDVQVHHGLPVHIIIAQDDSTDPAATQRQASALAPKLAACKVLSRDISHYPLTQYLGCQPSVPGDRVFGVAIDRCTVARVDREHWRVCDHILHHRPHQNPH